MKVALGQLVLVLLMSVPLAPASARLRRQGLVPALGSAGQQGSAARRRVHRAPGRRPLRRPGATRRAGWPARRGRLTRHDVIGISASRSRAAVRAKPAGYPRLPATKPKPPAPNPSPNSADPATTATGLPAAASRTMPRADGRDRHGGERNGRPPEAAGGGGRTTGVSIVRLRRVLRAADSLLGSVVRPAAVALPPIGLGRARAVPAPPLPG